MAVGSGWVERIGPDEAARHERDARALAALQAERSQRYGQGRALHRKPIVALRGVLRVHEGLPAHAREGLFAQPGAYEAWVRLSNGGPEVHSDRRPDVRGFAMRIFGVSGPAALGGRITHQDFTLINHPAFAFADSRPFVGLVLAASRGPAAVLPWALKTFGPLGMLRQLRHMKQVFARPFSGFATEAFFSAAPLACGDAAVRLRLLPPAGRRAAPGATDWRAELQAQLAAGPLTYRLQLQFFADEARTPIEDASVDWPESAAPYLDVADLVLEAQPEDPAFQQQMERSTFDPWQALAVHRPLGEVMRARKVAYFVSQKARGAA